MNSREYMKEGLRYYRSSFDLTQPYSLGGTEYEVLAEFHASTEKYVLIRKFKMWSENTDEYVLFSLFEGRAPSLQEVEELQRALAEDMEPLFVRKGQETLRDENHMYTYLTMALYCDREPAPEVIRAVKKTRFKKYYQHGLSGYSEGHMYLYCTESGRCWTNPDGREIKRLFKLVNKNLEKREEQKQKKLPTAPPYQAPSSAPGEKTSEDETATK